MHEYLLDNFSALLTQANDLQTKPADVSLSTRAAVIGFSLYYDIRAWGRDEFDYVSRFLTEDPMPADLNMVKGGREGFEAFLCLGLGALCGSLVAGSLMGEGLAKQEWYLIAFTSANNQEICRRYDEFATPVG